MKYRSECLLDAHNLSKKKMKEKKNWKKV